jgi:hypothetical protein
MTAGSDKARAVIFAATAAGPSAHGRHRAILRRVTPSYEFHAEVWLNPGEAGWHFVTLPADVADDIKERTAASSRAFGAVKVTADIGGHSWQTSLFPDTKRGTYLLPVKKTVRDKAGIGAGDTVEVRLAFQPDNAATD